MTYSNNIPAYVVVYNALYSDIINEVYKEKDFLPSESELAKKYSVSRNTLRQALAVLNEDGLIIKSQGKGTVIAERKAKKPKTAIFNPMAVSSREEITKTVYLYNFAAPTDIAKKHLMLEQSDLTLASNNLYFVGEETVGFSFVQIPVKTIEKLKVNVSDEEEIERLIETDIYTAVSAVDMKIKLVYANEMEVEFLKVDLLTPLLMMESILKDEDGIPMARCKYYFIPEAYDLHLHV